MSNNSTDRQARWQYWHSQDAEGREMPRAKREKVLRYYSKVISMVLSGLDDGRQAQDSEEKPARLPSRSYIEYILVALGFDAQDWTRIGDDEIIRLNTCHVRLTDENGHNRALERFRKQRERMDEWQSEPGNPILIERRLVYDPTEQRNHSEYRVPLGELLRDIIADAPVGTNDYHLKQRIKRHVRAYLERFDGAAKPTKKTKHPSPISDAHRSATLALKAFEGEARKSGDASAINLMRASFRAAFGEKFEQIFRPGFGGDNLQETQQDSSSCAPDICPACGSPKPAINPTTYVEKQSDENFVEKDGKTRGVI